MDKGIRPFCCAKFNELLPTRVNTREGNIAFRKSVMADVMEAFGIGVASASTHYNYAFQQVKKSNPELVEGLGRAEDKKGGRKPKTQIEPVAPVAETFCTVARKKDGAVVATGLTREAADELVAKAQKQKKAALQVV